jgi:hypothetical protein
MATVRAKMKCHGVSAPSHGNVNVSFGAVYSPDPDHENNRWSQYTPAASLNMSIGEDKPAAKMFEAGKEYYVDITEAPADVN